jgi:DnaJ-class molecular chaperone
MRCERCHGSGIDVLKLEVPAYTLVCDDCRGSGIAYCCDVAGANPPNSWPLHGSEGLYDPIKVNE